MSKLKQDALVQTLIARRMEANQWTSETLAQYWSFHIDGEGSDDGVAKRIAKANMCLENRFKMVAQCISTADIQHHLDKVTAGDPDWLAHLDIATRMVKANPSALNGEQMQQFVRLTQEKMDGHRALSETVSRSLQDVGLRAA